MFNPNTYTPLSRHFHILYMVNDFISEKNLLHKNEKVLIATSGGQDSIFIIKILFELQLKWNWELGILHCDHNWNSVSKLQATYVSQLAQYMQIDYYQAITTNTVFSEVSARAWRYKLIKHIAYRHQYRAVITAHTASDRIETFIYNLVRGSGTFGLESLTWKRYLYEKKNVHLFSLYDNIQVTLNMKYKENGYSDTVKDTKNNTMNIQIVRPLLNLTRTQIRVLLDNYKFPVWSDPTNRYIQIHRNRIRHRLLPYIRLYFHPNIDQIISQWTELVSYELLYLNKIAKYLRSTIEICISYQEKNMIYIALPLKVLSSFPIFLQRRIIKQCIEENTHKKMNFHQIEHIRLKLSYKTGDLKNISQFVFFQKKYIFSINQKDDSLTNETRVKLTNRFLFIQKKML